MKSIICAIVKNEQRYIREWVEHYLKQGFDKIYIFEDYGSNTHSNELQDYIDSDKVELTSLADSKFIPCHKKGTMVQGHLYSKFLQKCRDEHLADWCGFFDVDEFIMFEDGWDLNKLEEEFSQYGGILLSWKLYGANGHIKRPIGNVLDNYKQHLPEGSTLDGTLWCNVKSLVNVHKCSGIRRPIHVFQDCRFTDHKYSDKGSLVFCKAWINHYYSKSWEDYLDRIFSRGNMQNNFRCLDKFFVVNPEFNSMKEKMINKQRYRHASTTMWISREMKIMSGGNERRIKELQDKYFK